MSSVARVKFIKTKVIYQTKFHHIRITKSKVIHVQIPVPKWGKNEKSGRKFSGLQNGVIRRLQIGTGSREQIGARGVANTGSFRDSKSGQKDYKSGQEFQIGAKRFQFGARIINQGSDYELVQNTFIYFA